MKPLIALFSILTLFVKSNMAMINPDGELGIITIDYSVTQCGTKSASQGPVVIDGAPDTYRPELKIILPALPFLTIYGEFPINSDTFVYNVWRNGDSATYIKKFNTYGVRLHLPLFK